jgi:hypothetical protein
MAGRFILWNSLEYQGEVSSRFLYVLVRVYMCVMFITLIDLSIYCLIYYV